MTAKEARLILGEAPKSGKQSAVNRCFTQAQAVEIVRDTISGWADDKVLPRILEKRIYQVTRNQRRPRF